jgi:hypothetical protein
VLLLQAWLRLCHGGATARRQDSILTGSHCTVWMSGSYAPGCGNLRQGSFSSRRGNIYSSNAFSQGLGKPCGTCQVPGLRNLRKLRQWQSLHIVALSGALPQRLPPAVHLQSPSTTTIKVLSAAGAQPYQVDSSSAFPASLVALARCKDCSQCIV